jgi:hypothetical protein
MQRWTLAVGALAAALLAGAGLLGQQRGLLGYGGAEVYGHAWVQWWHGEALPAWPAGTDLAAGADPWPVIDPLVTALGAVLGRGLGYTAGWNLVVLLGFVGAFLGGAALARREGGLPWVGGAVLATGPAFVGSAASGLTEDLALGLLAGALALLLAPGVGLALLGGALLGLLAWTGPYLAWMGGVVALGLGLHGIWKDRSSWRRWLGAGLVCLAVAAPAAWMQGDRLGGQGHRAGQVVEQTEPLWRVNPWRGVDLASFVAPGKVDLSERPLLRLHPGYLGFIALGLALYGRRSRWWAVLGLGLLLAPGEQLRLLGEPLGLANPFAWLLDRLPLGGLFNHHGRFLLVGQLGLSVLAARGAARLPARGSWLGPALAAAIALEIALISPAPLPLPVTSDSVDPVWRSVDGGPVLPVPAAGPGVHFQQPLFEQRGHGWPLAIEPNHPGYPPSVTRSDLGRWLGAPHLEPPQDLVGLEATLVVRDSHVPRLTEVLGPPDIQAEGGAIWVLPR